MYAYHSFVVTLLTSASYGIMEMNTELHYLILVNHGPFVLSTALVEEFPLVVLPLGNECRMILVV